LLFYTSIRRLVEEGAELENSPGILKDSGKILGIDSENQGPLVVKLG
jgi:hypothetical protein